MILNAFSTSKILKDCFRFSSNSRIAATFPHLSKTSKQVSKWNMWNTGVLRVLRMKAQTKADNSSLVQTTPWQEPVQRRVETQVCRTAHSNPSIHPCLTEHPLVAFHHQLMCTSNDVNAIGMVESRRSGWFLTPGICRPHFSNIKRRAYRGTESFLFRAYDTA